MKKQTWGGSRPGSGRPKTGNKSIHIRIDSEANEILKKIKKKGEFVSQAIKKFKEQ